MLNVGDILKVAVALKKIENSETAQFYESRTDGKTNALTTVQKDNNVAEPVRIGTIENNDKNQKFISQGYRIYSSEAKSITLCGSSGGLGANTGLYAVKENSDCQNNMYEVKNGLITIHDKTYPIKLTDGFYIIRKLTVLECKRLQTVPDGYKMPCAKTQNYKMLGNGWTIDVIAHILSHIPNFKQSEFEILSMYDGMSCGHIALDKLGAKITNYYATEIDKYAIKTTIANYPKTIYLGDAFNVRKNDFVVAEPKRRKIDIKIVKGEQISLF